MDDMEIDRGRWKSFLRAFADGPGLTLGRLASEAGITYNVLVPDYDCRFKESTLSSLLTAASHQLGVDQDQLLAWLGGEEEPAVHAYLMQLPELHQCTVCKKWLPKTQIDRRLSKCPRCLSLQASPHVKAWLDEVERHIEHCEDATLVAAWHAVNTDPTRAITFAGMAEVLKLPVKEIRDRWDQAGLPAKQNFSGVAVRCRSGRCKAAEKHSSSPT